MIKFGSILFLALVLVLSACNGGTPSTPATPTTSVDISRIPGTTLTTVDIQKNVVNALNLYESMAKSECPAPKIANTEVTQKPAEANGTWTERWTVDRCGKATVAYLLNFTPDTRSGGAGFTIVLEKAK